MHDDAERVRHDGPAPHYGARGAPHDGGHDDGRRQEEEEDGLNSEDSSGKSTVTAADFLTPYHSSR